MHRIEKLEERQMMAADIDLVGGDLQMYGTQQSDLVSISEFTENGSFYDPRTRRTIRYSIPMISAHISNSSEPITENFRASAIDKISAWLGEGNDTFYNLSSETIYVHGEGGDDHLLEHHDNTPLNFIRHGRVSNVFGGTPMTYSRDADGRFTATRK